MNWIRVEDQDPPHNGYFLVWVPEWEGYGNAAHPDICWWHGSYWEFGFFPSVEDGAPISHWAEIHAPGEERK